MKVLSSIAPALLVFLLVFAWSGAPRDIFAWAGVLLTLVRPEYRRVSLRENPALGLLLLWIGFALASALLAREANPALRDWMKIATVGAFAWSVTQFIGDRRRIQRVVTYLTAALATAYLSDIVHWLLAGTTSPAGRWETPWHFQHINTYAGLIVVGMPLAVWQARAGRIERALAGVYLLGGTILLWLFASRAAQLSLVFLALATLTTMARSAGRGLALVGLITLVGFAPLLNPRFLDPTMYTFTNRFEVWQGTTEMIGERPILGHGYGNKTFTARFAEKFPDRSEDFPHAHNQALYVAFGTGLLGLGLYIALWVFAILGLVRTLRAPDPASAGLAHILLLSIATATFFSLGDQPGGPLELFIWVLWAASISLAREAAPASGPAPSTPSP